MRSFATLLQQSKELGTSLSGALRVFSDEMRHKRMSLAEEKAHALPAKMSVPVTVCILPVVLMIAIIPIIVKMTARPTSPNSLRLVLRPCENCGEIGTPKLNSSALSYSR